MSKGTGYSLLLRIYGIFLLLLISISCDTRIKSEEAEVGEAIEKKTFATPTETYVVDTTESTITWIAAKITGRHNGIFQIQNGELYMTNGLLTGGQIIINMTTVRSDDKTIDAAGNQKLTTHLRSADFFDTGKHPTAIFEITGMAPLDTLSKQSAPSRDKTYNEVRVKNPTHRITGNLTIKDKIKSISFPARVTQQDDKLRAKANFNIDRTEWGIVYRSDKSLGNQTIYPEVNIGIDVVASLETN